MKPSAKANAVRLALCVGFFVAVFQKPLRLPEWAADVGAVVGFLSAVILLWMQIRAKRRGEITASPAAARRGIWIGLALIIAVTLSSPFWLPFTGITLGFSQLIISAFLSCTFGIAALLLGVWFRRRI